MLQIAISPVIVGEGAPFFRFSKPAFVSKEGGDDKYTILLLDAHNLLDLSNTIEWIRAASEDENEHLLAIAVRGDEEEARSIFCHIDGQVGADRNINLYVDTPRTGDYMEIEFPPPGEGALLDEATNDKHLN